VVLKRGEDSCLIETNDKKYAVKAIRIHSEKVIDTTAAGDSFNAGYLASRLQGEMLPAECAALGHCLASEVIQHRGAIISRKLVDGLF
jgi:2-dehydro-3-deoxygluconokinase